MSVLPEPSFYTRLDGEPCARPDRKVQAALLRALLLGEKHGRPDDLAFPNPSSFVGGCVNARTLDMWEELVMASPPEVRTRVLRWVRDGVTVEEFVRGRHEDRVFKKKVRERDSPFAAHPVVFANRSIVGNSIPCRQSGGLPIIGSPRSIGSLLRRKRRRRSPLACEF